MKFFFFLLVFIIPYMSTFCQDSESEIIGYTTKSGISLTLYGVNKRADGTSEPILIEQYSFKGPQYFVLDANSVVEFNGVKYLKINVPGRSSSTTSQDYKSLVSAPGVVNGIPNIDSKLWGSTFFVRKDDFDSGVEKVERGSRWFVSGIAVPFKIVFPKRGIASIINGGTLGGSFGVRLGKPNPWGNSISVIAHAGLSTFTSAGLQDQKNETNTYAGFSAGIGLVGQINKVQLGVVGGYDLGNDKYIHNERPWISIGIGFAFLNFKSPKSQGNEL